VKANQTVRWVASAELDCSEWPAIGRHEHGVRHNMEGARRGQGIFANPVARLVRTELTEADKHLGDMQIVGDLVVGLDETPSAKSERSQRRCRRDKHIHLPRRLSPTCPKLTGDQRG